LRFGHERWGIHDDTYIDGEERRSVEHRFILVHGIFLESREFPPQRRADCLQRVQRVFLLDSKKRETAARFWWALWRGGHSPKLLHQVVAQIDVDHQSNHIR
jgi:hypothetical protein